MEYTQSGRARGEKADTFVSDYCVIDTETTGLFYDYDRIIEIGILRVRNDTIVAEYNTLIDPERYIPGIVVELTGITDEMVAGRPKIGDVVQDVFDFIGNDLIIGHVLHFDLSFLINNTHREITNKYLDTCYLTQRVIPGMKSYGLASLAEAFSLPANKHRAIADCYSTHELYKHIKLEAARIHPEDPSFFARQFSRGARGAKGLTLAELRAMKPVDPDNIDKTNPFYGKHCAFTGTLKKLTRANARQSIVNMGAVIDDGVTMKTDCLIIGESDKYAGNTSKHNKANGYFAKGQQIEIMYENDFYDAIGLEWSPEPREV